MSSPPFLAPSLRNAVVSTRFAAAGGVFRRRIGPRVPTVLRRHDGRADRADFPPAERRTRRFRLRREGFRLSAPRERKTLEQRFTFVDVRTEAAAGVVCSRDREENNI